MDDDWGDGPGDEELAALERGEDLDFAAETDALDDGDDQAIEVLPEMGWIAAESTFRLRAPKARYVEIVFRDHPHGERQVVVPMSEELLETNDGELPVWTATIVPPLPFYRYRVHHGRKTLRIADPWSRAVVRRKVPGNPAWSVAKKAEAYDWRGDTGVTLHPDDAIIYEAHVGDLTAHPSAGAMKPGTYAGLTETHPAASGGLPHLMRLGVNALELLPLASFPLQETAHRHNHWGYMPTFPLAPTEVYGAAFAAAEPGDWVGIAADGSFEDPAVELKNMIRALHQRGVAVIVDVVLNHVSLHDKNPLLLLDGGDWFRRDDTGHMRNDSGCGNDLATENIDMRSLAVATIAHWLTEYHVDGVRMDLAELIDNDTMEAIAATALDIRPDALLIAEPWSFRAHRGGDLADMGWTVWNDGYRNVIKGRSPDRGGFIFGAPATREVRAAIGGSTIEQGGGFAASELSLNYLESHDDYTLGDFVRVALGQGANEPVTKRAVQHVQGRALRVHKVAAAALLATRGPVMIAQGQEFGRAKVTGGRRGRLCHNSYNKRDDTNHIDWNDRAANPELVAWYGRWIALRKSLLQPAWQAGAATNWVSADRPAAIGYTVQGMDRPVAVLINADAHHAATFDVGKGHWTPMIGTRDCTPHRTGHVTVQPGSAALLVRA